MPLNNIHGEMQRMPLWKSCCSTRCFWFKVLLLVFQVWGCVVHLVLRPSAIIIWGQAGCSIKYLTPELCYVILPLDIQIWREQWEQTFLIYTDLKLLFLYVRTLMSHCQAFRIGFDLFPEDRELFLALRFLQGSYSLVLFACFANTKLCYCYG